MKKPSVFFIIALLLSSCSAKSHNLLYKEKPGFYSYIIGDLKTLHIDKEHAADVHATPASCQKMVTTLLAIKTLGLEHRFVTALYTEQKGKIVENAVISFSGDPTFNLQDLVKLLEPLKEQKIKGKLYLDVSAFRAQPHSPNMTVHDIGTAYAQPLYSAIVDKNLIHIVVTPTYLGKPALVAVDSGYDFNSSVMTSTEKASLKAWWVGGTIKVTGRINPVDGSLPLRVSPKFIESYIINNKIAKAFEKLNITSKIEILDNKNQLPGNLVLTNSHESRTLKETLPTALKESDNLFFDSLYFTIINTHTNEPITDWAEGDPIVKDLLKKYYNMDFKEDLFVDGSGLSRLNRLQPRKLFELLKTGYTDDFVQSLPKPQEEGTTLENRHNLPSTIRAKTGNLLGITCLCGYSLNHARPKAFVIMAGSFTPPNKEVHEVIDRFIKKEVGRR